MSKVISFLINKPEVIAEVIDGELVAIHLGSGCYYHANYSGSLIWLLLENGQPESVIASELAKHYKLELSEATKTTKEFLQKLDHEKLIRPTKSLVTSNKLPRFKNDFNNVYEEPQLKKHEDMKELLLLDPIHDIGDKFMPLVDVK